MRVILLYVMLVGLPVVGLLGILRIGNTLEAPASVGGLWAIEPTTAESLRRTCAPLELQRVDSRVRIAQSGRYVQVHFNDAGQTSMVGRLNARTLTVRQVLATGVHARSVCGESTMAVLQLQIRRGTGVEDRLAGSWRMPECEVCPAPAFRAVRLTER